MRNKTELSADESFLAKRAGMTTEEKAREAAAANAAVAASKAAFDAAMTFDTPSRPKCRCGMTLYPKYIAAGVCGNCGEKIT